MNFLYFSLTLGYSIGYIFLKNFLKIRSINKQFKLIKTNKYRQISSFTYKENTSYTTGEIEERSNSQSIGFIKIFIQKFKDRYFINNFLDNLKRIKLIENKLIVDKQGFVSNIPHQKKILVCLGSGKNIYITFHELIHLAALKYDEELDDYYGGFSQSTIDNNLGRALDEAYTDLLTYRYFAKSIMVGYTDSCYAPYILIAHLLESVIGSKKMEEYYFNADLKGLVSELSNYTSYEKIIEIINKSDFLLKHQKTIFNKKGLLKKSNIQTENKELWYELYSEIIRDLYFLSIDKYIKSYQEESISYHEAVILIRERLKYIERVIYLLVIDGNYFDTDIWFGIAVNKLEINSNIK